MKPLTYSEAKRMAQEDADRSQVPMAVIGDVQGRRNAFSLMTAQSAKVNGFHVWFTAKPASANEQSSDKRRV